MGVQSMPMYELSDCLENGILEGAIGRTRYFVQNERSISVERSPAAARIAARSRSLLDECSTINNFPSELSIVSTSTASRAKEKRVYPA